MAKNVGGPQSLLVEAAHQLCLACVHLHTGTSACTHRCTATLRTRETRSLLECHFFLQEAGKLAFSAWISAKPESRCCQIKRLQAKLVLPRHCLTISRKFPLQCNFLSKLVNLLLLAVPPPFKRTCWRIPTFQAQCT